MSDRYGKGAYAIINDTPGATHLEGMRALTTFHEGFGHGLGILAGLLSTPNQQNSIRYENLVRRVLGITTMRDGTNPPHAGGKVANPTGKPYITPKS